MPAKRKFFTPPFLKLVKIYCISFILFHITLSALNWLVVVRFHAPVNKGWVYVLGSFILAGLLSYFVFKPIIQKLKIRKKASEALLWFVLPIPIAFSTIMSQPYITARSYSLITVNNPSDIQKYPHEVFFKIKRYYVNKDKYNYFNERHFQGKSKSTVVYSKNYILPMYDDPDAQNKLVNVACYLFFDTSMANNAPIKSIIDSFDKSIAERYNNYNFYNYKLFEKLDFYDLDYAKKIFYGNRYLNQNNRPFIFVGKFESINDIYNSDLILMKYAIAGGFGFAILIIFLIQVWNVYDLYAD